MVLWYHSTGERSGKCKQFAGTSCSMATAATATGTVAKVPTRHVRLPAADATMAAATTTTTKRARYVYRICFHF